MTQGYDRWGFSKVTSLVFQHDLYKLFSPTTHGTEMQTHYSEE